MIELRIVVEGDNRPIDIEASMTRLAQRITAALQESPTAEAAVVTCRLSLASAHVSGSSGGRAPAVEPLWRSREWVVYQDDADDDLP